MRILVISDSHQHSLDSIQIQNYDAIFHCGDYGMSLSFLQKNDIYFVKGNTDRIGDTYLDVNIFNKAIFMTHGHYENVKYDLNRLVYRAYEHHADICLFGHTHQVSCFMEGNTLFINPGAYPDSYVELTEEEVLIHTNQKITSFFYRW